MVNIIRLVDAAANRAREGLRVVEDYVRFVLDDAYATELLKNFRHDLVKLLSEIPLDDRMAARETQQDVGTTITVESERQREDAAQVLIANFNRIEESLRSLEEYCKVICPSISGALEQLRYQSYTLQKMIYKIVCSRETIPENPQIEFVPFHSTVDFTKTEKKIDFLCLVRGSFSDADSFSDSEFVEWGRSYIRDIPADSPIRVLVAHRCDLAAAMSAHGVLLVPTDLSIRSGREIMGSGAIIGQIAETQRQVQQAVIDAADFVIVSKKLYECISDDFSTPIAVCEKKDYLEN